MALGGTRRRRQSIWGRKTSKPLFLPCKPLAEGTAPRQGCTVPLSSPGPVWPRSARWEMWSSLTSLPQQAQGRWRGWTTAPSRHRAAHQGDEGQRVRASAAMAAEWSVLLLTCQRGGCVSAFQRGKRRGWRSPSPLWAGPGVPALSAAGLSLGRAGVPPAEGQPGPAAPRAPPGRGRPVGPAGQRRGHPQRFAGGGRAPQRPGGLHGEWPVPGPGGAVVGPGERLPRPR